MIHSIAKRFGNHFESGAYLQAQRPKGQLPQGFEWNPPATLGGGRHQAVGDGNVALLSRHQKKLLESDGMITRRIRMNYGMIQVVPWVQPAILVRLGLCPRTMEKDLILTKWLKRLESWTKSCMDRFEAMPAAAILVRSRSQ
mmetsp:Transcript_53920/g.155714  ORF Transcript_53920/g.155714 Transcript_53920/m.155714 type:complete len:142 (-) Transcript_53920:841-1266(-)